MQIYRFFPSKQGITYIRQMALGLTLAFLCAAATSLAQPGLETRVLDLVNQSRDSVRAPRLEWDSTCGRAAGFQCHYLAGRGLLSHSQETAGLETMGDRWSKAGGARVSLLGEICCSVFKNLRVGDPDPDGKLAALIVSAWKSSPEHRKIMLDPRMRFAGVSASVVFVPTGHSRWTRREALSVMVLRAGY